MGHAVTTVQLRDSAGDTWDRGRHGLGQACRFDAPPLIPTRLPRLRSTLGPHLWLLVALISGSPATAHAQRAGGSIGVSLTILEPLATRAIEVTGFRLGRDGRVTLETTAPTAGRISQLVMARVSSSANGFQPVEQPPVLLGGERGGEGAVALDARAQRMSHRVDVGRAAPGAEAREVQLRIEYLVVAGT